MAAPLVARQAKGGFTDPVSDNIIAFSSKDDGRDACENIAPTMRSMNFSNSHLNGGGQVAVAFNIQHNDGGDHKRADRPNGGLYVNQTGGQPSDLADITNTAKAGDSAPVVAFTERTRKEGRNFEAQEELSYALTNPGSGGRTHSRQIAGEQIGVRRLTPLECERLQGFPDCWTDGQADSTRCRQLGNAVAVPVVEWIARRLVSAA